MKTVTKTYTIYNYSELSAKAKERAVNWWLEVSSGDEWWQTTYDDAAQIGLKITSFDCGRANNITGLLTKGIHSVIKRIQSDHGKDCETYKLAEKYDKLLNDLGAEPNDRDEYDIWNDKIEDLQSQFEKELLEEYLTVIKKEWEYINSAEYIEEQINANEYTFDIEGRRLD